MIDPLSSPLLTDLYQFTMLQGYLERGMDETAVFEFTVRRLPEERAFLVSAGLESVIGFLEQLKFSAEELAYLETCGRFSRRLIDYLATMRFTGDIHAMAEGTIFFQDEPVIRITAPLCQAQFIETRVINLLQQQILFASKAARCILAAGGRAQLVDFGVRRAHGAEAGLTAARSSYLAGFTGTSTVLAETFYGIPLFGTMAHSFIEAHADERGAFLDFAVANPENVTLLIDTYDTLRGARRAVETAHELKGRGIAVKAVRLDSGDILTLSREVRKILDDGGFPGIRIFASGNLDEHAIEELLARGAPIDGFGVGTKLDTSDDAPYLECAYKLTEYAGRARMKRSAGKVTWPGRKQVLRRYEQGVMAEDLLAVDGEEGEGTPLIGQVMAAGRRIAPPGKLPELAAAAAGQLITLPAYLRKLRADRPYPVRISPAILHLREQVEAQLGN
ncbi:MAG: nicotinate phosphoribosyltransferase [Syntrophales bacterium]